MVDDHSVWHKGERALHAKRGVEERLHQLGLRMIRDHMPDQHREFFETLSAVYLSAIDESGHPWAVTRIGAPGFITSPDEHTLEIKSTRLPSEPEGLDLSVGAKISVVGIQFETQRRNRLNATITAADSDVIRMRADQSFGNCPKYIQIRNRTTDATAGAKNREQGSKLDQDAHNQIVRADTLLIASRSATLSEDPRKGVDINHRGGMPGFVRVLDDKTIEFPDYKGNNFFNTLGNITTDDRVGVQFIDFEDGTLLNVQGRAGLLNLPEAEAPRTGTLVRIKIESFTRTRQAIPHRYRLEAFSDRNPEV